MSVSDRTGYRCLKVGVLAMGIGVFVFGVGSGGTVAVGGDEQRVSTPKNAEPRAERPETLSELAEWIARGYEYVRPPSKPVQADAPRGAFAPKESGDASPARLPDRIGEHRPNQRGAALFYFDENVFQEVLQEAGKISKEGEDFEEAQADLGPNFVVGVDDPLDSNTNNEAFQPGDIPENIQFQSNMDFPGTNGPNPRGAIGLAVVTTGGFGAANTAVVANSTNDSFDVIFVGPDNHTAMGLNIVSLVGGGAVEVFVFDKGENLIGEATVDLAGDPPTGFLGIFVQDTTIGRVNIWDPQGGFEGLYDVKLYLAPHCRDGNCEPENGETCMSCPEDCGVCCGNGNCEPAFNEDCYTCPEDCGICCGNENCEPAFNEHCATCPQDCGSCGPCITQSPDRLNGIYSDADCDTCGTELQFLAEQFILDGDETINGVKWWGGYYPFDLALPTSCVTIVIYANDPALNLPGAELYRWSCVNAPKVQTGIMVFGVHEWEHTYLFPVRPSLGAGTYWIEIYEDTSGSTESYFWETGVSDPIAGVMGQAFSFTLPESPWILDVATDMAFELICKTIVCGDNVCDPGEDCAVCPADCGCGPCMHCDEDGACVGNCGNGTCDPNCGEHCATCPSDCPCPLCTQCLKDGSCVTLCGDGTCDPNCGENCITCPQDCGCGACQHCSNGACVGDCGNGTCQPGCGETCNTCPQDCGCGACTHCSNGACVGDCGNGACQPDCEETCTTCPVDCGPCGPCADCGPGPHWIDSPPCPAGVDVLASSGATVGIDLDLDCLVDTNLRLHGPTTIQRSGPRDDSLNFPGTRAVDGHMDVIDTEIVAMSLTNAGGVTMIAGGGLGSIPLAPTLGAIAEQGGAPELADSFFLVYFEVDDGGGVPLYNQIPLLVGAEIDCLPPDTDYIHPDECIPLWTSPIAGEGAHVANLVSADHGTFLDCGSDTAGGCFAPNGTPYCDNQSCCEMVCATLPQCCDGNWDLVCSELATDICQHEPCDTCGGAPHWIHAPPCPPGSDTLSDSGAKVGIDMDLDCLVDTSLRLHGPTTIQRSGPRDDSFNFPGTRPVDGHMDVIDTEIVFMSLTNADGVTMIAGAGLGAIPLTATLGVIAEQGANPDLADSVFLVFFEVQGGPLPLYNQVPLLVGTEINCLPPDTDYLHSTGCIPLWTSPIPGEGEHVANLVRADHGTFLDCGSNTAGDCFDANGTPYCDNQACCEMVCTNLPYCCNEEWDGACANLASTVCQHHPCEECGSGPHWIDDPPCPAGSDTLDDSGAKVGIDLDLDCLVETSLRLHGPTTIQRSDPRDDSLNFPGTRPEDGHLDVIDTEIVFMSLTNADGVTMIAGAGLGAIPLPPTLGAIAEKPTDPHLADSFFLVYFEVHDGAGLRLYNQVPLLVGAEIDCVPPDTDYIHPNECIPLWTSPILGEGEHVANLVSADHGTFLDCGSVTAGDCFTPNGTPHCEGQTCCQSVCAYDSFCCDDNWDSVCAAEAATDAACAPCTFTIGGAIYDDCKIPLTNGIEGITVNLVGTGGNFSATTSGGAGLWSIPDVPCGIYTVAPKSSTCHVSGVCPPEPCASSATLVVDAIHQPENQSIQFYASCSRYDMNYDGFPSIIGDVPPFVDCVYFGTCDCPGLGCTCPGDCNCDGFLSIIGDVPCFVDCVYFGSCAECSGRRDSPSDGGGFTIGGAVYEDESKPLLTGLDGITVNILDGERRTIASTRTAGPFGLWRIDNLPEGRYTAVLIGGGGEVLVWRHVIKITVNAENEAVNQSIQLLRKHRGSKRPPR